MFKVPKVSVILPAYNSAATILRALDSVGAQSFINYEIIVIDDGSTDGTAAIVETAAFDNLKLLRHTENRGAAAARNTGLESARGDLIAFLDADDTWRPDKLSRQVATMETAAANAKACTTGYYIHRSSESQEVRLELEPGQFRSTILFGCSISPGTTLVVERRAFGEIGPFDEALRRLEDWDWLLRFSERYDICSISEPLADVYFSESTMAKSAEMRESVVRALQHIRIKHIPRLQSAPHRRQLNSSILVEQAAIRYRAGQVVRAAFTVAIAFAIFPHRNRAFYRMLFRSLLRLIRGFGYRQN